MYRPSTRQIAGIELQGCLPECLAPTDTATLQTDLVALAYGVRILSREERILATFPTPELSKLLLQQFNPRCWADNSIWFKLKLTLSGLYSFLGFLAKHTVRWSFKQPDRSQSML